MPSLTLRPVVTAGSLADDSGALMSVHVRFRGGLGCNLFQYALGRIIATRLGLALDCTPEAPSSLQPARSAHGPTTLDRLAEHFPHATLSLPGARVSDPHERFEFLPEGTWDGQMFPLETILRDGRPRSLLLDGYFQRVEYFEPYLADIRRWLAIRHPRLSHEPTGDDIVVHISRNPRLPAHVLPLSYYQRLLSGMHQPGRVFICGDTIDDDVREFFSAWDPIVYVADFIHVVSFMSRFQRILSSNTAESWWAAVLSDAREIYGPVIPSGDGYAFRGFGNVDLRIPFPGYREVVVHAFAIPTARIVSHMVGARSYCVGDEFVVQRVGHSPVRIAAPPDGTPILGTLQRTAAMSSEQFMSGGHPVERMRFLWTLVRASLVQVSFSYAEPPSH